MRTTIRIEDQLFREVKALAARRGTTLQEVVEDALRGHVLEVERIEEREPVELPTSGQSGGTHPAVDISDSAALQELMDREALEEGGLDKVR